MNLSLNKTLILLFIVTISQYSLIADTHTEKTAKVFVLGTKHLSGMKGKHDVSVLEPLLKKLEALNPDLIAIEALGPMETKLMSEFRAGNVNALSNYGWFQMRHAVTAQNDLGMNWNDAMRAIEIDGLTCDVKAEHDELQRCLLTYLASYDYYTALLGWSMATDAFKEKFKKSYKYIAEDFDKRLTSTNEYVTIAVELAKRLGHNRLYPVDSHLEKGPVMRLFADEDNEAEGNVIMEHMMKDKSFIEKMDKLWNESAEAGDVLPYFQWTNSPEGMQGDIDFQWTPWLEKDGQTNVGHRRVILWEHRNLNMATYISRVMAENPGKTMIYVVGSSHKFFVEKYLKSAMGFEIIDAETVLGKAD